MIAPGTVAAIAATLLSREKGTLEREDLWRKKDEFRGATIQRVVSLAWDIALETEKQNPQPLNRK